jgi:NADPH:quinone reductase-like Zn-dependent oxidoreductase
MKAVVCRRFGSPDVVRLEEIDTPAVADDGVLVRVQAASVNPVDFFLLSPVSYFSRMLSGRGKPRPQVLGHDFAGTVESVGNRATQLQPGDEVFGGLRGAFAQYVSLPANGPVVRKPPNVTFEQAAAVPVAGVTALQAVRDHGRVQPGQKVLVNGASGGVGTFTVQIAKAFGADVTAVCSPSNMDLVRSLGADRVIDYTREDFTRGGQRYDVLLDVAGNHSWSECLRVMEREATFVLVGVAGVPNHSMWQILRHFANVRLASMGGSRRAVLFIAKLLRDDLLALQDLVQDGRVLPVIDRRYALTDSAEALRYVYEGHARGKVVLTV